MKSCASCRARLERLRSIGFSYWAHALRPRRQICILCGRGEVLSAAIGRRLSPRAKTKFANEPRGSRSRSGAHFVDARRIPPRRPRTSVRGTDGRSQKPRTSVRSIIARDAVAFAGWLPGRRPHSRGVPCGRGKVLVPRFFDTRQSAARGTRTLPRPHPRLAFGPNQHLPHASKRRHLAVQRTSTPLGRQLLVDDRVVGLVGETRGCHESRTTNESGSGGSQLDCEFESTRLCRRS